jgi:hypothetical protein
MKIIKIILISLIFFSCSESDDNSDFYDYHFFKNKNLNIVSNHDTYIKYGEINEGNNLVFEYQFSTQGDVDVIDDEYSEIIRFEINNSINKFNFTNEELSTNSKIVLSKWCECFFEYDPDKDILPTGNISGEKISETEWNISIDVTFYGSENRNITNKFILKE